MSDIFQYLSDNANYQAFQNFNKEELQNYKEEKTMGLVGLGESLPAVGHILMTSKNIYNKVSDIYDKGKNLVDKVQTATENSQKALTDGVDRLEQTAQKAKDLVGDTVQKGETLAKNTAVRAKNIAGDIENEGERFTGNIRRTATNAIEDISERADPHSLLDGLSSFVKRGVNKGVSIIDEGLGRLQTKGAGFAENRVKAMQGAMEEGDPEQIAGLSDRLPSQLRSLGSTFQKTGGQVVDKFNDGATEMTSIFKGAGQGALQEGQNVLAKTGQTIEKGVNEAGDALKASGSAIENTVKTGISSTLEEGADIGKTAISAGKEIATEAVSTVAETVGTVASEAIPVVGDLVALGMGIYDIFHSFHDKPIIYQEAKPVLSVGL
jgi:F0F1-type ATP synthase membrane subunit b/b'